MFYSIKNDKKNNSYKCYLCDRTRDKATGKVKSSDKYIMTLQYEDLLKSEEKMIKLKISYEKEQEKIRLIECLSKLKIKEITKPIKKYTKGKTINRFSIDIE